MNNKENAKSAERKRKYPLMPYLLGMLALVVAIVLLSYLAQNRNYQEISSDEGDAFVNFEQLSEDE